MRKAFLFFFVGILFLVSSFSANALETSNNCMLDISLINQDPYPAIPNDYVDIVFQVNGVENPKCGGVTFELIPSYPFSLDENDTLRTLEGTTGTSNWLYNNSWMIKYKLRIDKDALDGEAEFDVHYSTESMNSGYQIKKFNITIQDSRTNFDAVIQESTTSEVSIAIANTGKYTANSVVVRIPEQEGFRVTGTDGQMVGNLEAGDYTIVSFSLTRAVGGQESDLKFDIYYTDTIGVRRVFNMELPLQIAASAATITGGIPNFAQGRMRNNGFSWSVWYTLAIITVLSIIALFLYRKYPTKIKGVLGSAKSILHKKKKGSPVHSKETPEWIKKTKEKEKKK